MYNEIISVDMILLTILLSEFIIFLLSGEPRSKLGTGNICGQIWGGKYDDIKCDSTRKYVCQKGYTFKSTDLLPTQV